MKMVHDMEINAKELIKLLKEMPVIDIRKSG
jgi:hypothetical protein